MRLLLIIPHYFGAAHAENNHSTIGSYIEPLGRIAALSETVAALHANFGSARHTRENIPIVGDPLDGARIVDIVILAVRGHELTEFVGLDPSWFELQYVDCKPPWIGLEAQRIMRDRSGQYDFYGYLEDDLVIRDPAFFEKLDWFQTEFGPKRLLMPARFEMSMSGTPGKCIVDPILTSPGLAPFRRSDQQPVLEGDWHGRTQRFVLPGNPHSASHFISDAQLTLWMAEPTFDDHLDSWIGPLESAATFSVGRVFDLYKAAEPDPFFLEVQHYGTRYSAISPPRGQRFGEAPLLAIAQSAVRELVAGASSARPADVDRVIGLWRDQKTAVEAHAHADAIQQDRDRHAAALAEAVAEIEQLKSEHVGLRRELDDERARSRSPRWLLRRMPRAVFLRLRDLLISGVRPRVMRRGGNEASSRG